MREAFEKAVIARLKEGGFLEVEIRVEMLGRSGEGYADGSVDAYWHFYQQSRADAPQWSTAARHKELRLAVKSAEDQRNALQLLLNTADQRNADLEAAILKAKAWSDGEAHERLDEILDAVIGQSAIVTEQVQP